MAEEPLTVLIQRTSLAVLQLGREYCQWFASAIIPVDAMLSYRRRPQYYDSRNCSRRRRQNGGLGPAMAA